MLKVAPCTFVRSYGRTVVRSYGRTVVRSYGRTTKFFELDGLLLLLFRIVMGLRSASSAIIIINHYKYIIRISRSDEGLTLETSAWNSLR